MEERGLDDLSWLDDITEAHIEAMTAGERIALMWPMTVAGYLKQGIGLRNRPFRRDLVRVVKRLPDGTERVIFSTFPGEESSASMDAEWLSDNTTDDAPGPGSL